MARRPVPLKAYDGEVMAKALYKRTAKTIELPLRKS